VDPYQDSEYGSGICIRIWIPNTDPDSIRIRIQSGCETLPTRYRIKKAPDPEHCVPVQVIIDQDPGAKKLAQVLIYSYFSRTFTAHIHATKHLNKKKKVYCAVDGCGKAYKHETTMRAHIRIVHKSV
jgi:hypothetical protein